MSETKFSMTSADRQSAVWLKLKEHYTQRLNTLREQNDGNLDAEATAKIRGRIAEARQFLALGKEAPQVVIDD
jgi:hypothetical protein